MSCYAKKFVVAVLIGLVLVGATPGRAALVSTSEALALEATGDAGDAGATVNGFLAREEVAAELAALGVDPELARLRAAALSPSELEELAGRIREAPAGGSLLGLLGATFVVLLVLELVGVIDIFKKV